MPLTAVGKIGLDAVPGDPGRAGLLLEACVSKKALAQGSGAGAGAEPGQPAQTLLNNLIRGGLASSLPLPTLNAVLSGCVELSGWLNGLGLRASPATSVSAMSCKVCSLTPALPSLGQSPREVRRDYKRGRFGSAAYSIPNYLTWVSCWGSCSGPPRCV